MDEIRRKIRLVGLFIPTNTLLGFFSKHKYSISKLKSCCGKFLLIVFFGANNWPLCTSELNLFKTACNNCLKRFFGTDTVQIVMFILC